MFARVNEIFGSQEAYKLKWPVEMTLVQEGLNWNGSLKLDLEKGSKFGTALRELRTSSAIVDEAKQKLNTVRYCKHDQLWKFDARYTFHVIELFYLLFPRLIDDERGAIMSIPALWTKQTQEMPATLVSDDANVEEKNEVEEWVTRN